MKVPSATNGITYLTKKQINALRRNRIVVVKRKDFNFRLKLSPTAGRADRLRAKIRPLQTRLKTLAPVNPQ